MKLTSLSGLIILTTLCLITVQCYIVYYHGYKVFRIFPTSMKHIRTLKQLGHEIKLDIWRYPRQLGSNYDVMVKPGDVSKFTQRLTDNNILFQTLINDVERILKDERRHRTRRRKRSLTSLSAYTTNYLNIPEIAEFLNKIKTKNRQLNMTLINIGQSSDKRNLTVVKISKPSRRNKSAIFIDAGIHAREWIAPATAINIIYQLVVNPQNDRKVRKLLNKFDWYIMPVANPDGYHYSIYVERMWRKTRNINPGSVYRGTDANRNFNYRWNPDVGGSRRPGDDIYSGSAPFSVPESRLLGRFLLQHGHVIKLYLTLHSFGQYLLYPWGYGPRAYAADQHDLDHLAQMAKRAMPETYTVGTSSVILYPAAGGSDDFAKGAAGIKYSYTMELPPADNNSSSNYGFALPARHIPSIASHTWHGIRSMALELSRLLRSTSHVTSDVSESRTGTSSANSSLASRNRGHA